MKRFSKKQIIIALAIMMGVVYTVYTMNSSDTAKDCGTNRGKEYCLDRYIGLNEQEAANLADSDGFNPKLRQVDDDTSPNNNDSGGTPIFFTVMDGTVTKAELH